MLARGFSPYVRVRTPAEVFRDQKHFYDSLLIIFGLFIVQYGHDWYQNDGDKISCRMVRFD